MVSIKQNNHNGVTYKKIESDLPIDGAMAFGNIKLVLKGKPAIEIMDNSYKFGDQVQVTVYNKAGSVRKSQRTSYAGSYDRIELFFNKDEFTRMCNEYLAKENISGAEA